MPATHPIRPAIQNPQNSPKNDDASMLDFTELIHHTIPNQVKIRFCHNPTGRQRPLVSNQIATAHADCRVPYLNAYVGQATGEATILGVG